MQKLTRSLPIALIGLLLSCSNHNNQPMDTTTLAGLQSMSTSNGMLARNNSKRISKIRQAALSEIALSLGAQAGLAWRAQQIDEQLNKQARHLDTVFDFNALILEHSVLPPVLLEGRNTLNLANAQNIRISDRTYKVAKQSRFVTTAPNWRQYLWMDYKKPEYPDISLLPKTKAERAIWRNCVEKGWNNGVEQANAILQDNVARIKEDYVGMILYRKLLAMNMVSAPYVSHTELGVTGDGDEIRIDDRVLRITALPALNVNSKEWRAAVAVDEQAIAHFKEMESIAQNADIQISSRTWQATITPSFSERGSD